MAKVPAKTMQKRLFGSKKLQPIKRAPSAQAMWRLGFLHQTGQGVPIDHQETLRLYEKAANKGLVEAMWDTGQVYDGNLTIAPDPLKAKTSGSKKRQTVVFIMQWVP